MPVLGGVVGVPAGLTILLGIAAAALKLAYWRRIDGGLAAPTAESATSLSFIGKVRPLEPPQLDGRRHTGRNRGARRSTAPL